ncbi:MAG TPA: hypothetical protein VF183_05455, partial [Acidimicrobiales bacterium]
MSRRDPDVELADALRAVLARLHGEVADTERVREATALAWRMHELLAGPPRRRWYEGDIADGRRSREQRQRYNDRA